MTLEQRGPNTYRIVLSAGRDPLTGKRQLIRKTFKGTRSEAEREEMRMTLELGDLPADYSLTATLGTLLDAFVPVADWSPRYKYDCQLLINKYINRPLGDTKPLADTPLHKLRAVHLDRFYAELGKHVGADRVRRAHTIISSALQRGVKWEWIHRNVAADATQPSAPQRDPIAAKPAEVRALAAKASQMQSDAAEAPDAYRRSTTRYLRAAVAMQLDSRVGSRLAELCALRWTDIDLDSTPPTIVVDETADVVPGHGEVVKPIKGNAARHRAPKPIDEETADWLRMWDMWTADERASGLNPEQWVFFSMKTRSFYRPRSFSRDFRLIADKAGLEHLTWHKLRHQVVAQLRHAGVDIDAISRRVGHSRNSTTLDMYGGEVSEAAVTAAEMIARLNQAD